MLAQPGVASGHPDSILQVFVPTLGVNKGLNRYWEHEGLDCPDTPAAVTGEHRVADLEVEHVLTERIEEVVGDIVRIEFFPLDSGDQLGWERTPVGVHVAQGSEKQVARHAPV